MKVTTKTDVEMRADQVVEQLKKAAPKHGFNKVEVEDVKDDDSWSVRDTFYKVTFTRNGRKYIVRVMEQSSGYTWSRKSKVVALYEYDGYRSRYQTNVNRRFSAGDVGEKMMVHLEIVHKELNEEARAEKEHQKNEDAKDARQEKDGLNDLRMVNVSGGEKLGKYDIYSINEEHLRDNLTAKEVKEIEAFLSKYARPVRKVKVKCLDCGKVQTMTLEDDDRVEYLTCQEDDCYGDVREVK